MAKKAAKKAAKKTATKTAARRVVSKGAIKRAAKTRPARIVAKSAKLGSADIVDEVVDAEERANKVLKKLDPNSAAFQDVQNFIARLDDVKIAAREACRALDLSNPMHRTFTF